MHIPVLDRVVRTMIHRRIRGAGLVRRAANRICATDEVLAYTPYHSVFLLRHLDYVDRHVLREGYYEPEVLASLIEGLPQNGTFWDIGSNFGLHGITVKVMRPDVNVVCFEPSPAMSARILRHSELNRAPVTVMCLGLGDVIRLESFHIAKPGNPGLSSFAPQPDTEYANVIFSYMDTGDRLVESNTLRIPDLVKLDVEGVETRVLAGMAEIMRSGKIKRFVVEGEAVADKLSNEYGFSCTQILPVRNHVMDAPDSPWTQSVQGTAASSAYRT